MIYVFIFEKKPPETCVYSLGTNMLRANFPLADIAGFSFVPNFQNILQKRRLLKSQLEFPFVVLEMLNSSVWLLRL